MPARKSRQWIKLWTYDRDDIEIADDLLAVASDFFPDDLFEVAAANYNHVEAGQLLEPGYLYLHIFREPSVGLLEAITRVPGVGGLVKEKPPSSSNPIELTKTIRVGDYVEVTQGALKGRKGKVYDYDGRLLVKLAFSGKLLCLYFNRDELRAVKNE